MQRAREFLWGSSEEGIRLLPQRKFKQNEVADFQSSGWALILTVVVVLLYLASGSALFHYIEDWPLSDSLYFCVVIFTTIGDFTAAPTNDSSKVFTIFFALLGITILGASLGIVGGYCVKRQDKLLRDRILKSMKQKNVDKSGDPSLIVRDSFGKRLLEFLLSKLCVSVYIVLFFFCCGAIVMRHLEGWPYLDCFYFSILALTTIGYGNMPLQNPDSHIFLIFFLLFGTLFVATALGSFADLFIQYQQNKLATQVLTQFDHLDSEAIKVMDVDEDGKITEEEFVEYMLVHMGKATKQDFRRIREEFRKLDFDKNGIIDAQDIDMLHRPPPRGALTTGHGKEDIRNVFAL